MTTPLAAVLTITPETWPLMRRDALIVGIVAGELALSVWIMTAPFWNDGTFWAIVASTVLSGAVGAGVTALVLRRPRSTMTTVEADLKRGFVMMKRGLITEDDYHTLKAKIIDHYQPGMSKRKRNQLHNRIRRVGLWCAVIGLTIAMGSFAFTYHQTDIMVALTTCVALIGGLIVGTAGSLARPFLEQAIMSPSDTLE